MSGGHGYTWKDVRSRPASELIEGDILVIPGAGTAYHSSMDGEDVRGVGWQDLDGIAWTVTGRWGDEVAITSPDARDVTATIPHGKHVLVVRPEVKK